MPNSLDRSGVAIVAMVAIAQCLPLWQQHWFDSHESYAYVLRVVEFEAALRQGDLYPRWAPEFYGGYGAPFFVFYAPLVFAGSGLLSAFLGSAVAGLKLWIVLASVAAGTGVYAAVKAETQRADAALLAALVYLGSAYRLSDIYVRGDIAEYTALAILPWAVAAYRRVAGTPSTEVAAGRAVLAVGAHAALLLSHAVLGLWGTLLLSVLCLTTTYQLFNRRASRHVWLLWAAFALALGVSAVYTGPALLEKAHVHIEVTRTGYYEPLHQLLPVTRLLELGQFGILLAVTAALLLALVATWFRRGAGQALAWALAAATCAWLSTSYAEAFWQLRLPLTSFIQFPWRLHGLSALAAAMALGLAWAALFRQGWWREAAVVVVGSCALLASVPSCRVTRALAAGSFPETTSAIRSGLYNTTAGEYLPLGVAAGPTAPASALVASSPHVRALGTWSRGSVHELALVADAPSAVDLTLHMFPGWRVDTLKGPAAASLATSKAGLVSLRLPRAGSYRLRVSFGSSPLRAFCAGLSLFLAAATWPLLRRLAKESVQREQRVQAAEPDSRQWRRLAVAAVATALVLTTCAHWLDHAPTARASAAYSNDFPVSQALDGLSQTEWLLPQQQTGWLELELPRARTVRAIRLRNARNSYYRDRATRAFRLRAYSRGRVVASASGTFAPIEADAEPTTVPLFARDVTQLRIDVDSFYGLGGGLAEVEVQ